MTSGKAAIRPERADIGPEKADLTSGGAYLRADRELEWLEGGDGIKRRNGETKVPSGAPAQKVRMDKPMDRGKD